MVEKEPDPESKSTAKVKLVPVFIDSANYFPDGSIELTRYVDGAERKHQVHGVIIAEDLQRVVVIDVEHDGRKGLPVHGWFDRTARVLFANKSVASGALLWAFNRLIESLG